MSEPAAFFEPDGERFAFTVLTRGPWRPEHQHGGPPAALMARAIECAVGEPEPLLPLAAEAEPFQFPFFRSPVGYHTAVESRLARGVVGSGRAAVWMRQRVPLVMGETPSPAQRILVMADSGSGVGAMLDPARLVPFINADLTVSLHRLPEGESMGLDAVTTIEPHGIGLTRTGLYDVRGATGQGLQALVAGQTGPG